MEQATINTVAPESTTAALAAAVPKESDDITVSSVAPESTTAALAGEVPVEMATPGADAVPGGFIETPASEKIDPTSSEVNQVFAVNPLPASDTAENPITLAPGEPVPKDIGTQSLESNVHLDKASYEAGATNFPVGSFVLPEVVTPVAQREAEGRGVFEIPPITSNMIPESSLPITSAAEAEAAKAEAEAEVEAEVPEIVKESQEIAGEPAEASAVPEVVEHKAEVESELKSEVEVVPAIAEAAAEPATPVPEVVKESIAEAAAPAEATANKDAVEAKELVEAELKQEVVEALPISEADKVVLAEPVSPAPAAEESAAKIPEQTAPIVTDGVTSQTTTAHDIALNKPAETVPEPVKESLMEAGVTAEAASEPTAVVQKEAVEEQLKENVKPTEPIPATNGTKPAEPVKATDASPKTSIEGKPKKSIEGSDSSDSSPKKKRRSFFGALKEKLHFGRK
jgi:hypothetical protein